MFPGPALATWLPASNVYPCSCSSSTRRHHHGDERHQPCNPATRTCPPVEMHLVSAPGTRSPPTRPRRHVPCSRPARRHRTYGMQPSSAMMLRSKSYLQQQRIRPGWPLYPKRAVEGVQHAISEAAMLRGFGYVWPTGVTLQSQGT